MELPGLALAMQRDAVAIVFVNVLLQQLGLPIPAVPTMLLVASVVAAPPQLAGLLVAAVAASVVADWVWYQAGKRFGYRVLAGLCRLSINPASCVSSTEARFVRWGMPSLVVAKFIPGFSTVAPPIAGALRMPLPAFLLAAGAGGTLWAGLAIGAGWVLRDDVARLIDALDRNAGTAFALALAMLGAWLGWKLWQRRRFSRSGHLQHITPEELLAAMSGEERPLVLDLRGATMIAQTGPIPGARVAEHDRLEAALGDWPLHLPIVTLCACPEDASAIQAARRLLERGYRSVRPLRGGYDAWAAAAGAAAPDRIDALPLGEST